MAKEPKFNCIEKWVNKNSAQKFYEFPNPIYKRPYCVVWKDNPKTFWTFWSDFQWEKTIDGVRTEKGDWKCDGNDGFIIISEVGKIWKTDDPGWKDTPEPSPAPAEATPSPEADDSFPLKEGSEGPNVVKLQKFLNDKIPSNPLTVNGKFDEKTKNKLIEFQKIEGII